MEIWLWWKYCLRDKSLKSKWHTRICWSVRVQLRFVVWMNFRKFSRWRSGCSDDGWRLCLFLMDACLCAFLLLQWRMSIFHPRRTNSGTHLVASKVDAWCLTEQRMSLVVPVSGSLSCQADLRWQACGLGEVSSARCFRCMDTQFSLTSF